MVLKVLFHPYRQQAIDIAGLLLTITPDPSHSLFIISRVPVRVKHNQTVSPNEIEATASRFAAQHEDKVRTLGREEAEKNLSQPELESSSAQSTVLSHIYILRLRPIVRITSLHTIQLPSPQSQFPAQPSLTSLTLPHPPEKKSRKTLERSPLIASLSTLILMLLHWWCGGKGCVFTDGLLKRSTTLARFLMDMVPSKRTYKYLKGNPKIKTQERSSFSEPELRRDYTNHT